MKHNQCLILLLLGVLFVFLYQQSKMESFCTSYKDDCRSLPTSSSLKPAVHLAEQKKDMMKYIRCNK